ncbi:GntR family transcriptional regulator [Beduinella massiliensis]|mgnify:CR=1 FL=1|uniref:GntR family transcriptional regulator n=1 Tax=Beduinella massiliensis TaxID=1852363 RepID=UPI000C837228
MPFQEGVSIYMQVAQMIEDDILAGRLEPEDAVPSTNAVSRHFNINPATVAKGFSLLVDEGIIYKKRGIGMFVSPGSRELVEQKRQKAFFEARLPSLIAEAKALGIRSDQIRAAVDAYMNEDGGE